MVRARLLELRWSQTVSPEGEPDSGARPSLMREGPFLVCITPVIKYAMGEVLKEWEDEV